jgi:hypothetical protein
VLFQLIEFFQVLHQLLFCQESELNKGFAEEEMSFFLAAEQFFDLVFAKITQRDRDLSEFPGGLLLASSPIMIFCFFWSILALKMSLKVISPF